MSEGRAADKFANFPHDVSSARNRAAARTSARLFFGYFLLAKQNNSTSAAGPRPGQTKLPENKVAAPRGPSPQRGEGVRKYLDDVLELKHSTCCRSRFDPLSEKKRGFLCAFGCIGHATTQQNGAIDRAKDRSHLPTRPVPLCSDHAQPPRRMFVSPNQLHDATALVIEGNPQSRAILVSQLRELGLGTVAQCSRLSDARRKLEVAAFDVVICEQFFERESSSGQDLLDDLRRNQLLPFYTVFVMITAEASYSKVAEAAESALDAYLLK